MQTNESITRIYDYFFYIYTDSELPQPVDMEPDKQEPWQLISSDEIMQLVDKNELSLATMTFLFVAGCKQVERDLPKYVIANFIVD